MEVAVCVEETVGSATPVPPEAPSVAASRADFFSSSSSMRRTRSSVPARDDQDPVLSAVFATTKRS